MSGSININLSPTIDIFNAGTESQRTQALLDDPSAQPISDEQGNIIDEN